MLLKCRLVAKFVIEVGFMITLYLFMKPIVDSLPLDTAIKFKQNVVCHDNASSYIICVINKRLSEHSLYIGRITIDNTNNGHLMSPFCKWVRVQWI
jgi:hypothetical protein